MKNIIRRLTVLALAMLMVTGVIVPFSAKETASFTDVKSTHWFYKAVDYVVERVVW